MITIIPESLNYILTLLPIYTEVIPHFYKIQDYQTKKSKIKIHTLENAYYWPKRYNPDTG